MSNCSSKIVYYSLPEAKKAKKRLGGYFYECDLCGNFHLTSENPRIWSRRIAAATVVNRTGSTADDGAYKKPEFLFSK